MATFLLYVRYLGVCFCSFSHIFYYLSSFVLFSIPTSAASTSPHSNFLQSLDSRGSLAIDKSAVLAYQYDSVLWHRLILSKQQIQYSVIPSISGGAHFRCILRHRRESVWCKFCVL